MVHSVGNTNLLDLYEKMYLIRQTEEAIADRYPEGQMRCPTHLSIGQESVPAILSSLLNDNDYAISTHRGHAHYLGKGGNLNAMIAEIYGKGSGCSAGKGGSMHLIDLSVNFMGTSAIVGNSIPIGVGFGLSIQLAKSDQISVVFIGDGAVEEGVFYEAANFAVVRNLRVLFVCENNQYSVYSPINCRQPRDRKIVDLASAIGLKSFETNGYDLRQCSEILEHAVQTVRGGNGPTFVEAHTYRYREHCGPNYDNDIGYRTNAEYEEWRSKDPLMLLRSEIVSSQTNGNKLIADIEDQTLVKVQKAFDFAIESPFPDSQNAYEGVFSKSL